VIKSSLRWPGAVFNPDDRIVLAEHGDAMAAAPPRPLALAWVEANHERSAIEFTA
jgi:hypothetical protein